MTTAEILQRLRKEFPNRHVSFSVSVSSYRFVEPGVETDLEPVEISIWSLETKRIPCANLEDGINQLKLRLGMVQPEMELSV